MAHGYIFFRMKNILGVDFRVLGLSGSALAQALSPAGSDQIPLYS